MAKAPRSMRAYAAELCRDALLPFKMRRCGCEHLREKFTMVERGQARHRRRSSTAATAAWIDVDGEALRGGGMVMREHAHEFTIFSGRGGRELARVT